MRYLPWFTPPNKFFFLSIPPKWDTFTQYSTRMGYLHTSMISPIYFQGGGGLHIQKFFLFKDVFLPNGIPPKVFIPNGIPPTVFLLNGIPPMVFSQNMISPIFFSRGGVYTFQQIFLFKDVFLPNGIPSTVFLTNGILRTVFLPNGIPL